MRKNNRIAESIVESVLNEISYDTLKNAYKKRLERDEDVFNKGKDSEYYDKYKKYGRAGEYQDERPYNLEKYNEYYLSNKNRILHKKDNIEFLIELKFKKEVEHLFYEGYIVLYEFNGDYKPVGVVSEYDEYDNPDFAIVLDFQNCIKLLLDSDTVHLQNKNTNEIKEVNVKDVFSKTLINKALEYKNQDMYGYPEDKKIIQ